MRDPLALGLLTGTGFIPASKNIRPEFKKAFRVREIIFKSLPTNESLAWVGYEDMDPSTGVEVLDCLEPGESYSVARDSVDRLLELEDYGVTLADSSELILVTARID